MAESVTVDKKSWLRAMNAEAEKNREARKETERGGVAAIKEGKYKAGAMTLYGAQVPWLQPLVLGAGTYALATMKAVTDIQVFKDHWWLRPLVILGIGLWLQRRGHAWAAGLIASGSALFYQLYEAEQDRKAKEEKKPAKTTSGVDDAGYPWAQEGRWVRTDTGGWALEPHRDHGTGERIAHRLWQEEHARR